MEMKKSLIKELSANDMQGVIESFTYDDYYYPSIFPLMFTPTLSWKALSSDLGIHVAADVVSFNATAPRKTRNLITRLTGDIPKIEILRVKEETDLNEYRQLQNYFGDREGQKAVMNWVYSDTEFCWAGVNARLEWLALRSLSTGKFILNSDNNAGVVTETQVDFGMPDSHKTSVTNSWDDTANSTPITDIRKVVKTAMGNGTLIKYIYMDQDSFYRMVGSDETVNFCSSWIPQIGTAKVPTMEEINVALRAHRLPEIRIIESYVTIEKTNGTRATVNPWEEGAVTFVPQLECGYTYHAPMADELIRDSVATKVKREHILVKKYSTEDPVTEITKAIANAIPVWSSADSSYILNTLVEKSE